MNEYRVTFYANFRNLVSNKLASETMWVEANNEHHAVAEASMLAMAGTGNGTAETIGEWLRNGQITNVYSVIETN